MRDGPHRTENEAIPFLQSVPLAIGLFGFWIVLSGKLDAFHLGVGALASLVVAYLSGKLFALEPAVVEPGRDPFVSLPWIRLFSYVPWLAAQIALSALQVAAIVWRPRLNVQPKLFRFVHPLPHNMARATLANSITLTPGTVTLDVREDEYLVHALSPEAAEALEGASPGGMKERVAKLFETSG